MCGFIIIIIIIIQAFASSINEATMKERIVPDPQGLWMYTTNTEFY